MHQHQLRTLNPSNRVATVKELAVQQGIGGTQTQANALFSRTGRLQDSHPALQRSL